MYIHITQASAKTVEMKKNMPKRNKKLEYIFTARKQQEQWKSRVSGGDFFKKNQVREREREKHRNRQ
jgi:hypothetical protein